jgi:hypothetical protein
LTRQHVLEFCSPDWVYLKFQIKMADDYIIGKLLELYQKCRRKGEKASLFMETMNGKDTIITFTIKCAAGFQPASRSSCPRRRWKTPSQLRRDKERKDKFLANKLVDSTKDKKKEAEAFEPKDEITLQENNMCEKVFIIPKDKIENHNIGIEYDVTRKLEAKGLKVRKVKVERVGDPVYGDYVRSEVTIEPADAKQFEEENFEISKLKTAGFCHALRIQFLFTTPFISLGGCFGTQIQYNCCTINLCT